MQLLLAHQILIGAAILLSTLFGARAIFLLTHGDGAPNAIIALGSFALSGALLVYLRGVRARWIERRDAMRARGAKAS